MVKPITPHEVVGKKKEMLPDCVLEAFNELIAKYFSNGTATFEQNEAVDLISRKLAKTRQYVFDNNYLDVEEIYEKAGWKVEYDNSGHNENYPATFTFRDI
jgi:hypothetical protein